MTLPDGEPIPFMGWVNDIEGEEMNENQKKTTEQYRSNWDNIFKKKQDDKPKEQETKPSPGN
jgi:glucan phosphoethanolaminetransferase (alkaline phosphatase superfamily)